MSREEVLKPWEETWEAPFTILCCDGDEIGDFMASGEMAGEARAKLAAQAPAMARLLRDVLGLNIVPEGKFGDEFTADIVAVLKAAGVIP